MASAASSKTLPQASTRSASPNISRALYDANYRDAARHDSPDKVIFFEGARITLEAHMAEYAPEDHEALRQVLSIGDGGIPRRSSC